MHLNSAGISTVLLPKKKCVLVLWLSKEAAVGSQIDKNCQQLPAAKGPVSVLQYVIRETFKARSEHTQKTNKNKHFSARFVALQLPRFALLSVL